MQVVQKVTAAPPPGGDPLEFVMSDDSVDRYQEIIDQSGWQLGNFKNNPIALFGHDQKFVVGKWHNVRVERNRLLGRLELMPAVSDRLREIHAAIAAGVIRAVSVGFVPIERDGNTYTKSELVEGSLVAVPANPNALQVAKSLNLSRDTMSMIFGKSAVTDQGIKRDIPGKSAAKGTPYAKASTMNYGEKIERAQDRVVALEDQFKMHLAGLEPGEIDEDAEKISNELQSRIGKARNELEMFKSAEALLAATAEPVTPQAPVPAVQRQTTTLPARTDRPFAVPAQKINPTDYVIRAVTVKAVSHVIKQPVDVVRQRFYGDDMPTKVITDLVTRSASAPADTTTSGWASQLVQTINADFMESLVPDAVYPKLAAMGLRLSFGRSGVISIPSRSSTPTIAGSFVAEGAAIPVRQGSFTSVTLGPKKMAVISTMTREIAEHSIPSIETLIRDAIQEDTAVAIDTVLLDNSAATSIRPAGLRNGVSTQTATSGGGIAALVGDIGLLSGALISGSNGRVRAPVWIMNPQAANAIALLTTNGLFPFRDEINQGMLNRWPVIESSTVTAGMVILVDAADFVSVTGDDPRFDVSDTATLHMEDTTPLPLVAVGSPGAIPAPVRSLWQTDTLGIRMILPMNWAMRRTGVIAWTSSVTWD
jgi:HK97 family phage prohead protease